MADEKIRFRAKLEDRIVEFEDKARHCDKCRGVVEPSNDMYHFERIKSSLLFKPIDSRVHEGKEVIISGGKIEVTGEEMPMNDYIADVILNPKYFKFSCNSRHLLPTDSCEGSPSRASMILNGMYSFENRQLPKEEWKPVPQETLKIIKRAYEIMKNIERA